jgi:hypothetical protein
MVEQSKTNSICTGHDTVSSETVLKIAKEITVKFIEVGRITPNSFSTAFSDIYNAINKTVRGDK